MTESLIKQVAQDLTLPLSSGCKPFALNGHEERLGLDDWAWLFLRLNAALRDENEAKGKERGTMVSPNFKGVGRGHIRFYADVDGEISGKWSSGMNNGELVLYASEDGSSKFFLRAQGGTVWLTQMELAELFQTSIPNVNIHIKNVLDEGELKSEATIKEDLIVRLEGTRQVKRPVKLYNLDMILAVGYRVKSQRGTQFRQWATTHLREYLVKGFVMDDERMKDPVGWDYFDELLHRIREIRTSEKRFYQKVRDLFALSVDYKDNADTVGHFFAEVQNKMLYAVTQQTAAEIIVKRADSAQPNMALTAWKAGRVRKTDVIVAKNYLNADEIDHLNRMVSTEAAYGIFDDQRHRLCR